MEDVQPGQQTRVVVVNGQTIILQTDSGENLNDIKINSDLLQDDFHEAGENYSLVDTTSHESSHDELNNLPFLSSGCVAVYEEGGETQTIQLTAEQAQALGIRFTIDDGKNELSDTQIDDGGSMHFKEDSSPISYSEDAGQNESEVMFETQVGDHNSIQESMEMEEGGQYIETPQESLDALLGGRNDNTNQQITLVPQFINGQVRYMVEVQGANQDRPRTTSEQFADIDVPSPVNEISYSPELPQQQTRITFHNITSVSTTTSQSGFTPISTPLPTTTQTVNNYQCSRTTPSHASLLLNKVAKPKPVGLTQSYVTNVSTSATVTNAVQTPIPARMVKKSSPALLQQTPIATRHVTKPTLSKSHVVNNKSKNEPIPFFTKVPENVSASGLTLVSSSSKTLSTTSISSKHSSIVTTTGNKVIRVLGEKGVKSYHSLTVPASSTPVRRVMTSDGKLLSTTTANVSLDPQKALAGQSQSLLSKKIPVAKFNKSKPLGSSENPIQLVQHGQTFHSVQTLNQDQLKQIATVLQEKIYEKPSKNNTIYNAETNTRIIYRVVYPEDLEQKDPRMKLLTPAARGRGRRGRPPKTAKQGLGRGASAPDLAGNSSRSLDGEDEDRLEDSTKGERKNVVARTRSGRVSRPPRHMVKDYKRLHRLDFEEPDLDDSDGGYSDYTPADQDNEDSQELKGEENKLLPGLISTRRRKISSHFRCPTCQKIYLGHARMSRHFLAFPDHGSIDQISQGIKDSKPEEEEGTDIKKVATTSGRGRGKRRGPWAYLTPEARSERRKLKLREALTPCEADELGEVAGPAVAGVMSLWDLLLLRVDAVRTQESSVATLCDELGALLEKARSVAGEMLKPVAVDSPRVGLIELQDEAVCSALGITCGSYVVDDRPLRPATKVVSNKRFKTDSTTESSSSPTKSDSASNLNVLSALTLVAKNIESGKQDVARTEEVSASPTKIIDRELLLPSDSVMCGGTANGPNDLQIVDEIVNERLKNLTAGNGLDYVLSAPIVINGSDVSTIKTESHLINSLHHFQDDKSKSVWEKDKFDPEMELVAMGEGESQEQNVKMESSFSSDLDLPESSLGDEDGYDCQSALQGMEEGDHPPDNRLQFQTIDTQESDDEFEMQESSGGEEEDSFDTEMTIAAMGEASIQVQTGDSFDPDDDDDDIRFQNNANVSDGSFDPEMALAVMGEGNQSESSSKDTAARTFPGLGLVDVSLDESGPELDFEALSEEFNRNTSHSS